MKSNILINCLVLFYNVGIFPSDILTFFIFIDLHACSEVFATEPFFVSGIFIVLFKSSTVFFRTLSFRALMYILQDITHFCTGH